MNKKQLILDYYKGIMDYCEMYNTIVNGGPYDFSDKSDETLRYAKSALIANFFLYKEEQMIEKKANVQYESKLVDEELERTVNIIATKVDDEYQIGHFKASAPTMVATIRNKFAHGDYYVDAKNNKIVLNKDNMSLELDIDKLINYIYSAVMSCIAAPKSPIIIRELVETRYNKSKSITNEQDLVKLLDYCKIVEFSLKTVDNSNLTGQQLNYFNQFIGIYSNYQNNMNKYYSIAQQYIKRFKQEKLKFNITKKGVEKEDTSSRLVQCLSDFPGFYGLDLSSQIGIVNYILLKLECPDYDAGIYMYSNVVNLRILQEISKKKNTNIDEIFGSFNEQQVFLINSNMASMFIINDIARFTTLFSYPLNDIYSPEKYKTDRSNELDYSKLNLSFINPDILEINDNPLKEIEKKLVASNNRVLEKQASYEEEHDKYEASNDGRLETAKEMEKKKRIFDSETEINKLLKIEYNLINNDFTNNSLYFRNRAIIEGIRNAISHGNIEINDLNSSIPVNNLITFTNEYKGKIYFKLTISLEGFQQIFNEQNRMVIYNFLNPKVKLMDKMKRLIKH